MTRILVENLNGLDLGGITTHIFNYISVLQRSSDYKIDIVVTVQENNDVIDKFKSLGCGNHSFATSAEAIISLYNGIMSHNV